MRAGAQRMTAGSSAEIRVRRWKQVARDDRLGAAALVGAQRASGGSMGTAGSTFWALLNLCGCWEPFKR